MQEIYLLSSLFMLLVLGILFARSLHDVRRDVHARFVVIVVVVITLYVAFDAAFASCFMAEGHAGSLFGAIALIFFALYSIAPCAWYVFVKSCFFDGEGPEGRFRALEFVPALLLLVMVAVSVPTGILWGFDEQGQYVRGPLFESYTMINLYYYVASAIVTLYVVIKRHGESYYVLMMVFSCIPLAGILVNTYIVPISVAYPFQPFCLVIGVLFAYMFVVERKRELAEAAHQEELRLAVEEARRANASKTDFLRRMSHDIRTPINGIRGMIQIADYYDGDLAKQRECRGKVWRSTNLLLSLVNDILDMSKLESGKLELQETAFDLRQALVEVRTIVEAQCIERDITYIDDGEKSRVEHWRLVGSELYLKRVLINFASNAIKYNREGGSVSLWCRELSSDGERAIFEFGCEDTGIGMSEEFLAHAFEPFSQEAAETRTHYEGSGLGLAIAKQLIELMGGSIELASKQNEGTSVRFVLPFKLDEAPVPREEASEDGATVDMRGVRALLAEDNELNAEITMFMLERLGIEVAWVDNGAAALQTFAESELGHFDVIFMDVMMPEMDGLEAAARIRALDREDASKIPIFALTANAFADDAARSLAAGMNEHLSKPLQEEQIVAALKRHLG